MKTENEKMIGHLNNLVEINNDRIQGYERASNETSESDLKNLFSEMANHSRNYREELSREVKNLGGEPTEGTRNSGKIFRVWMDIKAALTGKDRKAIIAACERGEDAALEAYDDVLNAKDGLAGNLREVIVKQRTELQKDHDHIKALRDSVKIK
ncbi:MAG TPA: PA2169 family four-helix-bundle protein [Bacteroidia bacterium]|jgi:uncharacterized protein (TIGR02284 family)